MKKYQTPTAEKIEFDYTAQVVASGNCKKIFTNEGETSCTTEAVFDGYNK